MLQELTLQQRRVIRRSDPETVLHRLGPVAQSTRSLIRSLPESQVDKMKTSVALASTLASAALGAIEPKNFIFVIPDGMAPASVTLARTYVGLTEGGSTPGSPGGMGKIAIDITVREKNE